jgi:two-component system, OmpR family, copper resistance phosphate regulon response regulator CusR
MRVLHDIWLAAPISMKILIVEDEKKSSDYLKKGLQEAGFIADVADNGNDGLDMLFRGGYDLALLDIMLPGCDGWHILTEVRRRGLDLPVMFLTARDGVDDRVKGLELGADDYLAKPFAFSELVARLRTILRRGPVRQTEVLIIADLEVDSQKRKASRAGRSIILTQKEFSLLLLLCRRSGEVLTRTYIAEQVWDMNFDSETNVIDVHIRRLRQKIDEPFAPSLIHTVRGVGYVLEERR